MKYLIDKKGALCRCPSIREWYSNLMDTVSLLDKTMSEQKSVSEDNVYNYLVDVLHTTNVVHREVYYLIQKTFKLYY